MKKIIIILSLQLFCFASQARLFQNSYVSFELPANWNCKVSGTEWVCKSTNPDQAKQAIIVLTAKEVGPNDNLPFYKKYLETPKVPKYRDGTAAAPSKLQHLKTLQISNHPWMDGLHMGSLLPNFYSRYLVTIKDKIAILVVFNAKKDVYTQYSKAFFDAINSLKVTVTSNGGAKNIRGANESLGVDINSHMEEGDWNDQNNDVMGGGAKKNSNTWLYGVALILAGAGIFFLLKKKKK